MSPDLQLVSLGLLAAVGNMLGGMLIARSQEIWQKHLRNLIALGAGFMLAAVFLAVLPEIDRQWEGRFWESMVWVLGGYLLIQLAEHTIAPHFHFGEETHQEEMQRRGVAVTAVVGLSIHSFFDGVAIASGLLTSFRLGILLFIAILLHKVPEGFTVATIMLSAGRTVRAAWRATLVIAGATFAGIISVSLVEPVVIYALPFSAGVTIYVAATDLIPEVNHEGGVRRSLLIFVGVALFYLTHLMLHAALGE